MRVSVSFALSLSLATGGAIVACSSFSSSNDPPPIDEAGIPESGSEDAPPIDAAPIEDAGVDAPATLLSNSDFELGCAGWFAGLGDVVQITDLGLVHGGTKACRMCSKADAGTNPFFLSKAVTLDASHGTQFYGEAYARTAPGMTAPASFLVRVDVADGTGNPIQIGNGGNAALTASYQLVSGLTDVGDAGVAIQLTIRGTGASTCFIVDDALLYQKK